MDKIIDSGFSREALRVIHKKYPLRRSDRAAHNKWNAQTKQLDKSVNLPRLVTIRCSERKYE